MQPGDVQVTYADVRKAEKWLDFKPKISIEKGVKNFVTWYKNYYNF